MDMIQDWMIINKIKMGDPDAWDILVHKYYDSVYFYCVRRCYGDCDIASDLTQDIFLKFFLDELFKSFTTGMWELEQTFKYDLRQHIMMKLLIFGIIDMVIVILLSLMTKSIVSLPLYQILVYVLVPYNIVCIILFSLITIWRKQLHNYFLWCISGSICVAVILIANIFKIYEIRMLYWGIAYFITTTILGIILYSQTKIIKWEVASVWN